MLPKAVVRLMDERILWKCGHPRGFIAEPCELDSPRDHDPSEGLYGGWNYFLWYCTVPGKKNTPWEGGLYRLNLSFDEDFPVDPPTVRFINDIFHPNVVDRGYLKGEVIDFPLITEGTWRPQTNIAQILLGVQDLLVTPNIVGGKDFPPRAVDVYLYDRNKYIAEVRKQAERLKHGGLAIV